MMCESKMISKNNDEVDVGCGNAFGGEGVEEAGQPKPFHPLLKTCTSLSSQ